MHEPACPSTFQLRFYTSPPHTCSENFFPTSESILILSKLKFAECFLFEEINHLNSEFCTRI
jgi:hypothetical protein